MGRRSHRECRPTALRQRLGDSAPLHLLQSPSAARRRRDAGFTLAEVIVVLVLLGLLATIGLPALFRTTARLRLEMAGREVASVLRQARFYAIRHSTNVALRFETFEDGRVLFRLHKDGDGDGVLNRDIEAGIDPAVTPLRLVRYLGADVGFSFPQRAAPLHPSTGRPLQNLADPIRFNRSDLASFAPLGTATPGTLYLSDRRSQLVAVRVVSRTGRVRIQRYDYETRRWTEI